MGLQPNADFSAAQVLVSRPFCPCEKAIRRALFMESNGMASTGSQVAVALYSEDRLTDDGARSVLKEFPDVRLVSMQDVGEADVLLVFAGEVSGRILGEIDKASSAQQCLRTVLIAETISEPGLLRAVGMGVVAFLARRDATFPEVVKAVVAARSNRPQFPAEMLSQLLRHIRRRDHLESGDGLGLDQRDLAVLAMLAEGADMAQIARDLNYSERTIKSIVRGITDALGVRNRTQAVAYVVRAGLL